MRITKRNLPYHELIGLHAEIVSSTNPSLIGIKGKIVWETKKMLVLEKDGREKKIPKDCCRFSIILPSGEKATIDGKILVGRPEDRLARVR
jgi:ribonuclease P protein subunit POP4